VVLFFLAFLNLHVKPDANKLKISPNKEMGLETKY
jgi:hypothetical protein